MAQVTGEITENLENEEGWNLEAEVEDKWKRIKNTDGESSEHNKIIVQNISGAVFDIPNGCGNNTTNTPKNEQIMIWVTGGA